MTKESITYKMLFKTKVLLEADIKKRRDELSEISKQGAELWEGDQWHSTAYREQQQRKELAIRYLQLIDKHGGTIGLLEKPVKNEFVEIGHMVKVELLDDMDVVNAKIPFSRIHVLTESDAQYLAGEFDLINEMVVSNDSPIGRTLLGMKRNEVREYLQGQRVKILETEDAIDVSYLF